MIKLLSRSIYSFDEFVVEVLGINSEQLNKIMPICNAMDRKLKQRLLDIATDEDLTMAFAKSGRSENLTMKEILKISEFNSNNNDDFTIDECKELLNDYLECIVSVKDANGSDVKNEFLPAVFESPKHLKLFANLIFQEYKNAIDVPELKKNK